MTSLLLQTSGVPPFGANGLAFNGDRSAMFVVNTGNDTVVRIPVSGGSAGTPAVFVNSVNGADGLITWIDGVSASFRPRAAEHDTEHADQRHTHARPLAMGGTPAKKSMRSPGSRSGSWN